MSQHSVEKEVCPSSVRTTKESPRMLLSLIFTDIDKLHVKIFNAVRIPNMRPSSPWRNARQSHLILQPDPHGQNEVKYEDSSKDKLEEFKSNVDGLDVFSKERPKIDDSSKSCGDKEQPHGAQTVAN
mmetsp:Transcript_32866/g.82553  ORF Transcript_32866/g.82553 Transcript_32866/m.82553 type:complete len:127 (-) Transcript_32866:194-574(-)